MSSCPAGTPLKGLNYLKGRDDPVALKEEEYPEWLWTVMDKDVVEGEEGGAGGDEFCESAIALGFLGCTLSLRWTGIVGSGFRGGGWRYKSIG